MACLTVISGWRKSIVNCFCCRPSQNPLANSNKVETSADTPATPPGNPTAPADQDPPAFNEAEVNLQDLNEMLEYITQLCASLQARAPSSAISRLPSQWVAYKGKATSFLESLPPDFSKQVAATGKSLILPVLNKAFGGAGSLHWMAAGCSLMAWAIETIDSANQNWEESVKLLSRTVALFKSMREIWQSTSADHVQVLQESAVKAFECAIVCSTMMGRGSLLRFLGATPIKDAMANLDKDLTSLSQQISTFLGQRMFVERLQRQVTLVPSTDGIVGGDEVKREAMAHLKRNSSELVAVCLHGMGGVGKSCTGKAIFAEFQRMMVGRCCKVELQWEIKVAGLCNIQKEILEKLCRSSTPAVSSLDDGKTSLEKELKKISEPVFLYVDNVLNESHLSDLLPHAPCFPKGSRILVTTRHEFVRTSIDALKIRDCKFIAVKKLDERLAKELLRKRLEQSKHAPESENSAEGDVTEALERELLGLCDGLPLALTVVGGYIASSKEGPRKVKVWQRAIEAMKKAESLHGGREDPLYSSLMFSITDLLPQMKMAFLDIVAFAEGWEWEIVEHLVSEERLEGLYERALVEKGEVEGSDTVVRVHDVLKQMGLRMVEGDKQNIRVTSPDVLDTISRDQMKNVVGLMNVTLEALQLVQMPRLRILQDVRIQGECLTAKLGSLLVVRGMRSSTSRPFPVGACKALKVLEWHDVDDASDLEVLQCDMMVFQPKSLSIRNWSRLHNVDTIILLWSLRRLDLSGCRRLQVLPEGVGSLTGLSSLDLSWCGSLQVLPEGVGSLTGLSRLDLSWCGSLQVLPEGVGSLTGLSSLHLNGCWSLQVLPEGVGSLTGLSSLDLRDCGSLQVLPEGVGSLTGLSSLDLRACRSLQVLPEGVGSLTGLSSLDLSRCERLQALPEGVGSLTGLSSLDLSKCGSLQVLPEGVGSLTGLTSLDLSECERLQVLPEGVGSLTGLTSLYLSGCRSLQVLPEGVGSLTGLSKLDLSGCGSLQVLPEGVGSLTGLSRLDLSGCKGLQVLPEGVGRLTGLSRLHLSLCRRLQVLPEGVGSLTGLSSLDLSGCESLQVLPEGVGSLTGLSSLGLSGCRSLQVLPEGVGSLTGLSSLGLSGCRSLQVLPEGVGNLTGLSRLVLSECGSLQVLPEGVGNLTGLSRLVLSECGSLQVLPEGVGSLAGLRSLDLSGCRSLQVLPEGVGSLTGLRSLDLSGCGSLQVLPEGVGSLTGLRSLDLSGCGSLQVLPEGVGSLTGLSSLGLSGCGSLQVLPEGVGSLVGLSSLDLSGCGSLQVLPEGVGSLTGLSSLDLSGCGRLRSVPETIVSLTGLEKLWLTGCCGIKVLPYGMFGNFKCLKRLALDGCSLPPGRSVARANTPASSLSRLCNPAFQRPTHRIGQQPLHFTHLLSLPEEISKLTTLKNLELRFCFELEALPRHISQLTGLTELAFHFRGSSRCLPDDIEQLTSLTRLFVSDRIDTLPSGLSRLEGLQIITI